jgi:hypothetical protein
MTRGKFQNLQANLCKRILLWGDLSQGGKEVMIKSVAQAVMTYIMGVFKLSFSICDELTRLFMTISGVQTEAKVKHTG